jgi:hypothetical protein
VRRRLEALDRALLRPASPREQQLLHAQRALLLARLGESVASRRDITILRADPGVVVDPELAAWAWLAEGVCDYYDNLGLHESLDRVQRACAMAAAAAAPLVQALAAAWRAHLELQLETREGGGSGADRFPTGEWMRWVVEAFSLADEQHHAARSRAALVMAWVIHLAGGEARARPWYALARSHASLEGDGATMSALMHNLAALQVLRLRLDAIQGVVEPGAARRVLLTTESSGSLDASQDSRLMRAHLQLLRAQAFLMLERYPEALALYDRHLGEGQRQGLQPLEALFMADRARCLLALGQTGPATGACQAAERALGELPIEEACIVRFELARSCRLCGDIEGATRHEVALPAALARLRHSHRLRLEQVESTGLESWGLPERSGTTGQAELH